MKVGARFIDFNRVMPVLILILVFTVLAFSWVFYLYNRLTQLRNVALTEWAHIDVLLKKRADLIPNIIEVVKGYAKHESETLERIATMRGEAGADSIKSRAGNETELSKYVAGVMALRESYPDLKANQSFQDLQKSLFDIENEIAEKRKVFNEVAKGYNDIALQFPGNVAASILGFSLIDYFEFTGSEGVPEIKFND